MAGACQGAGQVNYFRLHVGDYLRDTAHLSLLEHGVYARLLQVYYTRESPIPDSEKYRVIGARLQEERDAVDSVLREFFALDAGGWRQQRCDREIAAYQEKAERNRDVGRLGGRPVKSRNPEETQTVSTKNPDVTLASSQEPRAKEQREEKDRESAPDGTHPSRGCRIPAEFPDQDALQWAQNERPELATESIAEKFRDYWAGVPGARGRKSDWPATWRNFVRSERAHLPPARAAPQSRAAAFMAALREPANHQTAEVIDVRATVIPATTRRLGA